MNTSRFLGRATGRRVLSSFRSQPLSTSTRFFKDEFSQEGRIHSNADQYREDQKSKPEVPQMTNTTSANNNANEVPSVGADKAPPEFITSVDPNYTPKDRIPENTERMTGGTQSGSPDNVSRSEYSVGEMEGAKFRIEPLRRVGEDAATMRARLLYQSRKRGILESDLLLSTFAAENLESMNKSQLEAYDLFLDENDWDIYYWATQSAAGPSTSVEYAEGAVSNTSSSNNTEYASPANPATAQETDAWRQGAPKSGEWAQTVGTFKPAYRPVPQRWKESEILALLRKHIKERSAGGVLDDVDAVPKTKGTGLGRMPDVSIFNS